MFASVLAMPLRILFLTYAVDSHKRVLFFSVAQKTRMANAVWITEKNSTGWTNIPP